MSNKSFPERALAAYYRGMARQQRADLPLDALPSRAVEQTVQERDYVMVCNGSRILAVYRIRPAGWLYRLRQWPKALELRL